MLGQMLESYIFLITTLTIPQSKDKMKFSGKGRKFCRTDKNNMVEYYMLYLLEKLEMIFVKAQLNSTLIE